MPDSDPTTFDTGADAVKTTTAGSTPRWWRNRRGWFYLIVTLATVALLWGGWSWWYRAGFPMPQLTASGARTDFEPLEEWFEVRQHDLLYWKLQRETRSIRLEGTVWESPQDGFELAFSWDGHLLIKSLPEVKRSQIFDSENFELKNLTAVSVDGEAFQFVPNVTWPDTGGIPLRANEANLRLPKTDYDAHLTYDGHNLTVVFADRKNGAINFDLALWFTRVE